MQQMTMEQFLREIKKIHPMINSFDGQERVEATRNFVYAALGAHIALAKQLGYDDEKIEEVFLGYVKEVMGMTKLILQPGDKETLQ